MNHTLSVIATEYDLVTNSLCLKVSKHEIFYLMNFVTVSHLDTEIW
jgi:hypothetical protein